MPPLETSDCQEDAVVWPLSGQDDDAHQTFSTAYDEVKVRWVRRQSSGKDAKGNNVTTDVQIACNQELTLDSVFWLGALDDIPGTSLVPSSDLWQVKTRDIAKDISGKHTRYEFGLVRWHDNLADRLV